MAHKKIKVVKKKKEDSANRKEKIVESLDLPRDVILNTPNIQMEGKSMVHVENYRGILEYTEEVLRINTKIGVLKIEGKRLNIKVITSEDIHISGYIKSVEFQT